MMNKCLQKTSPSFNKFYLISILSFYVAIAHIFLPAFGKKEFFFLFRWSLYTHMPEKFVYDLTWDDGKSYVLRDYRKTVRQRGEVKYHYLQYLVQQGNTKRIKRDYKEFFLNLCQCEAIYFVRLKGKTVDHFIYKKQLETIESIKL